MGRSAEKGKDKQEDRLVTMGSERSEEEVDDTGDREETPDLYRNSALGMLVIFASHCVLRATDMDH